MDKIKTNLISMTDYALSRRKVRNSTLDDIDRIVDWTPFEILLKKHIKRKPNAVGNPAYPCHRHVQMPLAAKSLQSQ